MVATHSVEIFLAACQAIDLGIELVPRGRLDKEHFAQDWFTERLAALGLPYRQQGRNSYPDFWVGDETRPPIEGYEVKSLAFAGQRPARKDYDSNSTIPSGRREGRDVFLTFILYQGSGPSLRTAHSLAIAHTDLVNSDHEVAEAHFNEAIHGFGSYGDGFIRNRKMYVFPHPFTLDPTALGRRRLIVPAEWELRHKRLGRVGILERSIAAKTIKRYAVDLYAKGNARIATAVNPHAGQARVFDVFEPVRS